MAEWLYEDGIGEARAALVADGRIVRAIIEPDAAGPRVGAVLAGVLAEAGRHPRVTLASGGDVVLNALPPGISVGRPLLVEIVRERLLEGPRVKLPRAVIASEGAVESLGPSLRDRIAATGLPVRQVRAHEADALEAAGWSEVLEEAASGDIAFADPKGGGMLRLALTPAMTVIDVDGDGPADALAVAAAGAVAAAIVRHGIGGSIAVDFPTVSTRAARMAIDAAVDAAMASLDAGPFERTATNGYGLMQIIRPRAHASLPELLAADPVGTAARAALRRLERQPPPGPAARPLLPRLAQWLRDRPDLIAELHRRTGNSAPITDMGG